MADGIGFEGERLRHVAMPLGGIGAGQVAITGAGTLSQWQISNQGNHLGFLPQSFFALRISSVEPPLSCRRMLEAPALAPSPEPAPLVNDDADLRARYRRPSAWPGVRSTRFAGGYPFARVEYEDDWPIAARLEAYTPFVPLDPDASGLPLASFTFTVTNHFRESITAWLFGSLQNVVGWDGATPIRDERCALLGGNRNTATKLAGGTAILMTNDTLGADHPGAGSMAIWSDRVAVEFPQFDDIDAALAFVDSLKLLAPTVFEDWSQEALERSVSALRPAIVSSAGASGSGRTWAGGLAIPLRIGPGEQASAEIVMAWHFPNRLAQFDQFGVESEVPASPAWIGNHYAMSFAGVGDVLSHYAERRGTLREQSAQWHDALFGSALPEVVIEVLGAQPSLIRSPTTFRTADGRFFGFEGVLGESSLNWNGNVGGSCPLNCTHVWNYEQAVSRLFPSLERSMRETDWEVLQAPDGSLPHRVLLPLDTPQLHGRVIGGPDHAALDGMLGTILKTYREARQGAGLPWLADYLPRMRRLMDYVRERWDPARSGVLTGAQPVTHDISLHGPNIYVGGLWLAALRTMQTVLAHIGEQAESAEYGRAFEAASAAYDSLLWSGEYYTQKSEGESFDFGAGCLADQLLGQWWAHQLDLGYLLPRDHVTAALRSVLRYNLRTGFRDFAHGYRVFADADDTGLLNCSWPHGGRPKVPIRYADEVWTGVEYQVAAHCLFEGLRAEALALLSAIRARHDGSRRNPYNEIENGDHYARAMAGWSVLEALTGGQFDALSGRLRLGIGAARYPLLAGAGWGEVSVADARIDLLCNAGTIAIGQLAVSAGVDERPRVVLRATLDGRALSLTPDPTGTATLRETATLAPGDTLTVEIAEL